MQAMAPEVQGEPQLGHVVGSCGVAAAAAPGCLTAWAAAAAAGAGAGLTACCTPPPKGGTAKSCLHRALMQRTVLPAALSGTCIAVLQWGQLITFGMVSVSCPHDGKMLPA